MAQSAPTGATWRNPVHPALYHRFSAEKDPLFLELLLAMTFVESRFDPSALSGAGARGLLQLTDLAVLEAVQECHLSPVLSVLDLNNRGLNIRLGSCYLRKLLRETGGDQDRALVIYNGGYRQLLRYDQGQQIASETANYLIQVNRALHLCRGLDSWGSL